MMARSPVWPVRFCSRILSEKSQGWPERRIDSAFCETRSLRIGFDSRSIYVEEVIRDSNHPALESYTILSGCKRSLMVGLEACERKSSIWSRLVPIERMLALGR